LLQNEGMKHKKLLGEKAHTFSPIHTSRETAERLSSEQREIQYTFPLVDGEGETRSGYFTSKM
jgi:hypothetical protein